MLMGEESKYSSSKNKTIAIAKEPGFYPERAIRCLNKRDNYLAAVSSQGKSLRGVNYRNGSDSGRLGLVLFLVLSSTAVYSSLRF